MCQFHLMDRLGMQKLGYFINFGDNYHSDPICKLTTWIMVLKGGISGAHVQSESAEFRNLETALSNQKKAKIGLVSLLNVIFCEIFGDRMQCMCVIWYFYRAQLKQNTLD